MPRIRVEDIDELDDLDLPSKERIKRQPKEEKYVEPKRTKKSHYNPEAAHRKEYSDNEF